MRGLTVCAPQQAARRAAGAALAPHGGARGLADTAARAPRPKWRRRTKWRRAPQLPPPRRARRLTDRRRSYRPGPAPSRIDPRFKIVHSE